MPALEQARLLGGIGSILMLLAFVPYAGPVLSIIGFILVLIAVKYISDHVGDRTIFNNYLIAMIIGIISVIVAAVMGVAGFLGSMGLLLTGGPIATFAGMIMTLIAVLVVVWILGIIAAIFIRRSFNSIATALNVKMFATAALLYLIGAILTIIIVGAIIALVAIILQIIAFFQIPAERAPPPPPPPPA
ncbi:MAG: DUF996 domain-containing protein [Thaumarchaeota archaeon]|jgi:uncharacterized membrane protein|nr:DUF996 domain-containing protein [Nitrososphaerota archaeon]MCL7386007.1 DUF996 domain-containing protein [Candidatus Wolframiiraptor allenii]